MQHAAQTVADGSFPTVFDSVSASKYFSFVIAPGTLSS